MLKCQPDTGTTISIIFGQRISPQIPILVSLNLCSRFSLDISTVCGWFFGLVRRALQLTLFNYRVATMRPRLARLSINSSQYFPLNCLFSVDMGRLAWLWTRNLKILVFGCDWILCDDGYSICRGSNKFPELILLSEAHVPQTFHFQLPFLVLSIGMPSAINSHNYLPVVSIRCFSLGGQNGKESTCMRFQCSQTHDSRCTACHLSLISEHQIAPFDASHHSCLSPVC